MIHVLSGLKASVGGPTRASKVFKYNHSNGSRALPRNLKLHNSKKHFKQSANAAKGCCAVDEHQNSGSLRTFGLPCRAHPGAALFPPQRTYTVSRCIRSPKRRQPAEASNTRPLMSLSDVACEGSHMRYETPLTRSTPV